MIHPRTRSDLAQPWVKSAGHPCTPPCSEMAQRGAREQSWDSHATNGVQVASAWLGPLCVPPEHKHSSLGWFANCESTSQKKKSKGQVWCEPGGPSLGVQTHTSAASFEHTRPKKMEGPSGWLPLPVPCKQALKHLPPFFFVSMYSRFILNHEERRGSVCLFECSSMRRGKEREEHQAREHGVASSYW